MTAPTLGLAAAAKACNVSESTIRRKRTELLELGAVQGAKGWQIPVPALIQLGLMENSTPATVKAPSSPSTASLQAPTEAPNGTPSTELETLRKKLAEAEQRAAVAEAVAQERERIIDAQARTLRMLEAPRRPDQEPPAEPQAPTPAPVKRSRWWPFP